MKREEAIKEMREKLPWLTEDTKRLVEALIPELAESEDEWMLQTIIRGFENWKSNGKETFNFANVDDILAYLEKQKEPHYTKRNALFDKCVENCDPEVMKSVSDEMDEMLEKERKPAEWNEDSVKFEEGFKAGRESGLRDGQKYVLNNLDSYGLCKPAEWSEELKNELAKKHLEGYIMGREDTMREMKDFLESHFNTQSGTSTSKAEG